ncbi:uncharacterized protein [Misgurnus anguillicaudatus]|uniref:uncharacterized protein n=1 Tax=Misgurnus anguillicaudatus TaxID=75329 RepID=UPI003CCF0867
MNFRLSSLILLLHIQGSLTLDNFNVTCDAQNICAMRGEMMTVSCFYSNINIKTGFWFSQKQRTNWRNKDEPEDLTLDSDYSGRADQWIIEDYSRLTIRDVRERDSGEYQLMFIMKDGVKHLSSVTVNLTVTGVQVKMTPESTGQRVKLSCDSSCPLTSKYIYHWYKNGQRLTFDQSISVSSSENTDSYYCFEHYSDPSSSVLEKTYWDYSRYGAFSDLREDHWFAGRVEFVGNTLRIKDVSMSDTGRYQFRFITNTSDEVSCSSGVYLTVTGFKPTTLSE